MADKTLKNFIRILRERAGDPSDTVLRCELIEAGYITGEAIKDEHGLHKGSASTSLTTKGRMFLIELEKKIDEEGWRSKALSWGKVIGAFIVGLYTEDFQRLGHAFLSWATALFHH